jgi:Fe-S oxidoreductase
MLPVGGKIFLLFLISLTLYIFGRRACFLIRLLKLGKPEDRFEHLGERLKYTLGQVFAGNCTLKNISKGDYAGIGHLLLLYGFSFFLISYVFHIAEGFYEKLCPAIFGFVFNNLFFLSLDIAGLIVIGVIIWAAIRRYIVKPDRLEPTLEAGIILVVVFCLMLLNYVVEGFRFLTETKPFADWSFVGIAFSHFFMDIGLKENSHTFFWIFWWLHLAVVFGFSIYVLYSKHLHILASHFNLFFHPTGPEGALHLIKDFEEAEAFGVSKIAEFSWRQLLDLYACTVCGRCQAACPAYLSEKPLSPKRVIQSLKEHLWREGPVLLSTAPAQRQPKRLVGTSVSEDELWACTTCLACVKQCPVSIEPMKTIVDLRRGLVLTDGKILPEIERVYRNLEWFGDPLGMGKISRDELTQSTRIQKTGSDGSINFVFWVGCQGYFHERNRKTMTTLVKFFQKLNLKFTILGRQETCCGDVARRTGNEYLFKTIAEKNIDLFKRKGITKIVTHCPHCFNVFKNEYPQLGGELSVSHYTELLRELFDKSPPNFKSDLTGKVTFHDPCYLSRYNGIISEPRSLLRSIPCLEFVEMNRSKEDTFCCGAGGGGMWLGRQIGKRMNEMVAEEALVTKADYIATACPYCFNMIEDGMKSLSKEVTLQVVDIVELLDRALV